MIRIIVSVLILFASMLAGCGAGEDTAGPGTSMDSSSAAGSNGYSATTEPQGTLVAVQALPVEFAYQVLGNPVVGQPVAVSLRIQTSKADGPLTLSYRVSEPGSLIFPDSQASEIELAPSQNEAGQVVQVTVIPQREGRVYLNVSATMQAAHGSSFKSMAIPILVEGAPPSTNGMSGEAATEQPDTEPPHEAAQ
jgi:uncharacterized protein (DUF58 family)